MPPGRVQFRTSAVCDHGLNQIIIDTQLLNATGNVVATGPSQRCLTSGGCFSLASTGDVSGLPAGAYTQQATVTLVLNEPNAPDPWVVTPGTSNPPTDPARCAGGDYDTTCRLRLGVILSPTPAVAPWSV